MKRTLTRAQSKKIINLLRQRQPRTLNEFRETGLRPFDLKKLLKSLVDEKIIIKESASGEEKFWLNEAQGVDFLGRDPSQRKRLKHPKKRVKKEKSESDDSIYR